MTERAAEIEGGQRVAGRNVSAWIKRCDSDGAGLVSDVLDDFREDADPADVDEAPDLVYGSVDEFAREFVRHMYTRPVGSDDSVSGVFP